MIVDMSSASEYMGAKHSGIWSKMFGMSQIFDMSPPAVNFQFESQFEFPDPADSDVFRACVFLAQTVGMAIDIAVEIREMRRNS